MFGREGERYLFISTINNFWFKAISILVTLKFVSSLINFARMEYIIQNSFKINRFKLSKKTK